MSNYIISNGELHNVDEIAHWKYIKREKLPNGKWKYIYDRNGTPDGRNLPTKKFEKAIYRADKLQAKVDKAEQKADKAFEKAEKKQSKVSTTMAKAEQLKQLADTTSNEFVKTRLTNAANRKEEKAEKQQVRADKATEKVSKAQAKVERKTAKLERHVDRMEKNFADVNIDVIDEDVRKAGERYIYMLSDGTRKTSTQNGDSTKLPDLNKKLSDYTVYSNENGVKVETHYSETDELLSRVQTVNFGDSKIVFEKRGRIDRAIDNGQAYLDEVLGRKRR